MPLPRIQFVALLPLAALTVLSALSQNPVQGTANRKPSSTKPEIAVVTSVRVVHERGVPALEILSTLPSVPSIQFLNSPPRLVVDLLHARMGLQNKRIDVQQEDILAVRAEQYQEDPPIARIVLDLLAPSSYTWDEAGNRLMVRLKTPRDASAAGKKAPIQPPAALPPATAAVVPVTSVGEVVLAQSQLAAGSTLTTGGDATVLRLSRGGEVRICPGTTVSVTPAKNAKDLMLGMSTGALETHYALDASADTVLTPDFRILFAGPGEFDFAISADAHGNTCVRGLAGNTSSAIVSELMGERIYQVRPTEEVVFRSGRIDKLDSRIPPECGCPRPVPVMRADSELSPSSKAATKAANSAPAQGNVAAENGDSGTLSGGPETQPLPASQPNAVKVQVDAPFVFRAKKYSAVPPAPTDEAAALPAVETSARQARLEMQFQPQPAAPQSSTHPGSVPHRFLRRVKGFFVAIFG